MLDLHPWAQQIAAARAASGLLTLDDEVRHARLLAAVGDDQGHHGGEQGPVSHGGDAQ